MTILAAVILLAGHGTAAAQSCATALNEFREIVRTERSMGHVSEANQSRALTELARIEQLCGAGQTSAALEALRALQRRLGFR